MNDDLSLLRNLVECVQVDDSTKNENYEIISLASTYTYCVHLASGLFVYSIDAIFLCVAFKVSQIKFLATLSGTSNDFSWRKLSHVRAAGTMCLVPAYICLCTM